MRRPKQADNAPERPMGKMVPRVKRWCFCELTAKNTAFAGTDAELDEAYVRNGTNVAHISVFLANCSRRTQRQNSFCCGILRTEDMQN